MIRTDFTLADVPEQCRQHCPWYAYAQALVQRLLDAPADRKSVLRREWGLRDDEWMVAVRIARNTVATTTEETRKPVEVAPPSPDETAAFRSVNKFLEAIS